ncbi:BON domain-containing protein [Curtobacterium sp. PhB115]|uniref:BON domain-containing protein n=1 Tax=Curtobacterium sp. PhB115 TaxID=2485173 RepID=UPI000F4C731B|nr:BON domain-containing protein [Curtobacterium sp. PhB115]ROP58677.1 osmotically-inducible protein OsmY [Curtobacterium sp. PhB115]
MTTITHTEHRSDSTIKHDVQQELEWTPGIDATAIGVAVDDGVVTLSGTVDSFTERIQASRAALRVQGVHALADDIMISAAARALHTDAEIAHTIRQALDADATVPEGHVQVEVADHTVTLHGDVPWHFQRLAAIRDAERVAGVKYVLNHIGLTPRPTAHDTENRIKQAFVRHAQLDADRLEVSVQDSVVTLTGRVASAAEKREAELAAWRSPHVTDVQNLLIVQP